MARFKLPRALYYLRRFVDLEIEEYQEMDHTYLLKFKDDFKYELMYMSQAEVGVRLPPRILESNTFPTHAKFSLTSEGQSFAKKLYRHLAKLTHPDICNKNISDDTFKDICGAYKNNNIASLLSLADNLGLDVPCDTDTTEILLAELRVAYNDIKSKKETLSWIWCRSMETSHDRHIIRVRLGIDVPSFKKWFFEHRSTSGLQSFKGDLLRTKLLQS